MSLQAHYRWVIAKHSLLESNLSSIIKFITSKSKYWYPNNLLKQSQYYSYAIHPWLKMRSHHCISLRKLRIFLIIQLRLHRLTDVSLPMMNKNKINTLTRILFIWGGLQERSLCSYKLENLCPSVVKEKQAAKLRPVCSINLFRFSIPASGARPVGPVRARP